jgi:hypothetical protein
MHTERAKLPSPASQLSGELDSGLPNNAMMARHAASSVQMGVLGGTRARPSHNTVAQSRRAYQASLSTSKQISPVCARRIAASAAPLASRTGPP